MKRAISLILALVLCLSLCACSVKLTEDQQAARTEADEIFDTLKSFPRISGYSSEIKKIDKKIVYIVKLDFSSLTEVDVDVVSNTFLPSIQESLNAENIYMVVYFLENGDEKYRIVDNKLNPSILD